MKIADIRKELENQLYINGIDFNDLSVRKSDNVYRVYKNHEDNNAPYSQISFDSKEIRCSFNGTKDGELNLPLKDYKQAIEELIKYCGDKRIYTKEDFVNKFEFKNNFNADTFDNIQAFNKENAKYKTQIDITKKDICLNINGRIFALDSHYPIHTNIDKLVKDHFGERGNYIDIVNKQLDIEKKEYLFKNISSAISDELSKKTTEQDTRTVYKKNKI